MPDIGGSEKKLFANVFSVPLCLCGELVLEFSRDG